MDPYPPANRTSRARQVEPGPPRVGDVRAPPPSAPLGRSAGSLSTWSWARTGLDLVGVEPTGRVFVERPGSAPQTVYRARGVTGAAIDPAGRNVAVGIRNRVELVSADGGAGTVL